jgi:hypothetical protein
MCIQSRSMSSTATHVTKIFPKRVDITGSPKQAFHMQDNRDKYFKYLIGGISAGTIAAIGTIAPRGTFQTVLFTNNNKVVCAHFKYSLLL